MIDAWLALPFSAPARMVPDVASNDEHDEGVTHERRSSAPPAPPPGCCAMAEDGHAQECVDVNTPAAQLEELVYCL